MNLNPEQVEALEDIRDSLRHLATVARDVTDPVKAVLTTQIFILVQKVRYLLGEDDV